MDFEDRVLLAKFLLFVIVALIAIPWIIFADDIGEAIVNWFVEDTNS